MEDKPRREPVYGLDLIRFFAAAIVLFYHFGFKAWATADNPILAAAGNSPGLPPWWGASWWGWVGVQIFFVISGLVISYSVEGNTPARFVRSRSLRLVPTVWICATLALPVAFATFDREAAAGLVQWLRTVAFFPAGPWILGQFWTLPIEICFYGLVWLMLCLGMERHMEPLAWALALASALYFILVQGLGFHDPNGRMSALLLLQHGGFFALGILMSRADTGGYRWRHLPLALLCTALAMFQIRLAAKGENLIGGIASLWAIPFLIWLAAALLMAGSLHWRREITTAFSRHARAIRLMGLLTFPLYLIHIHAGAPAMLALLAAGVPPLVAIAAAAGVATAAAVIIVLWIEPPVHRGLARLLAPRRKAPAGGREATS